MSTLDQYTDSDRTDHEIAKAKLRRIFKHHTQRSDSVPASELAEGLPIAETTVRDLIQELRRDGLPIMAAPSGGYYWVSSVEDFEDHLIRLDGEIATKQETKRQLAAAFNSERVVGHE